MKPKFFFYAAAAALLLAPGIAGADVIAKSVDADLSKYSDDPSLWKDAKIEKVELMRQPMVPPMPKTTTTAALRVQAIHDGKWIAFRLRWADPTRDEAGKLGEFSDAVAIQFPAKEGPPPPIPMGAPDSPVHIFHWRAQYQRDAEKGRKEIKDIYPNMSADIYPMEFSDNGSITTITEESREQYAHGRAAGNPQAFPKTGVDEIMALGFGTSSVVESKENWGKGFWKNKEWTVVIARKMNRADASVLEPGKESNLGFAVWQGQAGEVGARKSVTMIWTPLKIEK